MNKKFVVMQPTPEITLTTSIKAGGQGIGQYGKSGVLQSITS